MLVSRVVDIDDSGAPIKEKFSSLILSIALPMALKFLFRESFEFYDTCCKDRQRLGYCGLIDTWVSLVQVGQAIGVGRRTYHSVV